MKSDLILLGAGAVALLGWYLRCKSWEREEDAYAAEDEYEDHLS